jgi:hypothetical protein
MAKLSSINKNERRKKLVKQYAAKYEKLKAIANDTSLDETERLDRPAQDGGASAQREPDPGAQSLRHHRPPPRLLPQVRLSTVSNCANSATRG